MLHTFAQRYTENYPMFNKSFDGRDHNGLIGMIIFGSISLLALLTTYLLANKWIQSKNASTISPLDIAKERLAKGDISKSEFDDIKKLI